MSTEEKKEKYIGRRVQICGDHPSAGRTGTFVRWADTPYGDRPVVEVDGMGGHEVTIMKPTQWTPLS